MCLPLSVTDHTHNCQVHNFAKVSKIPATCTSVTTNQKWNAITSLIYNHGQRKMDNAHLQRRQLSGVFPTVGRKSEQHASKKRKEVTMSPFNFTPGQIQKVIHFQFWKHLESEVKG